MEVGEGGDRQDWTGEGLRRQMFLDSSDIKFTSSFFRGLGSSTRFRGVHISELWGGSYGEKKTNWL